MFKEVLVMSNFYDNLVSGKYNTYEKVASAEDETVRETLSELTQDQIEALSDALGGITKRASELSLEDTLSYEFEEAIERTASEEDSKEETKKDKTEEKKEEPKEDSKKEESKKEDIKEKEAEEEPEENEEIEQNASENEELSELEKEIEVQASEDDKEDKDDDKDDKKEDKEDDKDGDDDDDDNSQPTVPAKQVQAKEKCAEEAEVDFEKLSAEEQFEITKQACEEVEKTLANSGYTLADYVYSLTGLEKHAHEIAEQAEKLASVQGIPALMVANDMLNAMNDIIDDTVDAE